MPTLPLRLVLSLLRLRSNLVHSPPLPSLPALPVSVYLIPGLFNLMVPLVPVPVPSSHLISPRLRLNIASSKATRSPLLTGSLFIPVTDTVLIYSAVKVRLQRTRNVVQATHPLTTTPAKSSPDFLACWAAKLYPKPLTSALIYQTRSPPLRNHRRLPTTVLHPTLPLARDSLATPHPYFRWTVPHPPLTMILTWMIVRRGSCGLRPSTDDLFGHSFP